MSVPRLNEDKRDHFLPLIAQYFSDHGYDGATTAGIAKTCGVRQNVLYRIWTDKEAMFVAVIEFIHSYTIEFWDSIAPKKGETKVEAILRLQSKDHGSLRYYRIIFSGLLQDSKDVRKALRRLYVGIHEYIERAVESHREQRRKTSGKFNPDVAAWGMMGLAAMADIQRELRIKSQSSRETLLRSTSLDGFLN
jgi:AcrR family transcriptional regulator